MKKYNKNIELLAPAGNLEKMKTAFAFGADAAYVGIPDFSLRVRINNFTIAGIKQAVKYAHKRGKKIYVTANIFAHNKHIAKLPAHIKKLKEINVDGIFISDPAVLRIIKKIWPKAKIILSTQANCANWQAAKFWHEQGVSRIILSRELSIKEIAEIHKKVPKLELECFVHGALCMAYSGRCFLSKFFSNRDANLGDCIQPCRWAYKVATATAGSRRGGKSEELKVKSDKNYFITPEGRDELLELVEEKHGSYILNSQDLCLIKRLDELKKAGVNAFKIEGRAKSVYYIANVVGAYSYAIQRTKKITKKELNFLHKELEEKLYNRGYTEGFMFGNGKMAQNIKKSHKKCKWEFCGTVYNANPRINATTFAEATEVKNAANSNNANDKYNIFIKVHNSLRVGDEAEIVMPKYDIIKMRIKNMTDSETGETLEQAHGGQGRIVIIESNREIPQYSVIRCKVIKISNL
ncbi:MAG: U32 family peptidase C-terminal domain-containing protein [Patescibacteria group bacterium]|nr:U32 family peptidase C-terminal domain-containing protein [Patescibacteria group bacterium]